ncbi:hypothetical protein D3C76_1543960 [compost metagenome]
MNVDRPEITKHNALIAKPTASKKWACMTLLSITVKTPPRIIPIPFKKSSHCKYSFGNPSLSVMRKMPKGWINPMPSPVKQKHVPNKSKIRFSLI